MRPIYKAWFCHIEVTNFCEKMCIYCSRWTRHLRDDQYYFSSLDEIEKALQTLIPKKKSAHPWPNRIGIQGGEPTLHPEFEQICELLLKYDVKARYGLWTYGGSKFQAYKPLIDKTFGMLAYNEHNKHQVNVCKHQPATVSIQEAIPNKELRDKLIDQCFVQLNWCPTISQGKAYFCEVAYGIDRLFEIDAGWSLDYDWFMKEPGQFKDQVDSYCYMCGMPVPMERQLLCNNKELVTPKLLERMKNNNLKFTSDKWVDVFNKQFTYEEIKENLKTWDPRNFWGDRHRDNPHRYGIKI
jgi:organic radical activating enzyme